MTPATPSATPAASRPVATLLAAVVVIVALLPAGTAAQTAGHDHAVLDVPSSTAAMAMGDAFDPSSGDSDAIFYNPGALARAEGFVVGLARLGDGAGQGTLSAAGEWFGGRVGLGLQGLEWGAGADPDAGGVGRLLEDGPDPRSEWAASAGYARELFGPSVGVVAKLVGSRGGGGRDVVGAVDLGVTQELGPVTLGLAARNLAGDLLAGDDASRVPETVTLGAGARGIEAGPLDLAGAARVTRRADGEVEAGGGLEVAYWPVVGRTFIVRVGVRGSPYDDDASPLTLGAAFHGDALVVEYAYQPADAPGNGGGLHRITLGWR